MPLRKLLIVRNFKITVDVIWQLFLQITITCGQNHWLHHGKPFGLFASLPGSSGSSKDNTSYSFVQRENTISE